MAKLVKCPYCENKLDKDESVEYKKRYYHPECLETQQMEGQHYKELINYICELHGLDRPTGMMLKQIKEQKEDLGYKYKGMELALRYFYETLGNLVQEGTGIGIIPFVYEEAKKHYVTKLKVEQSVDNVKLTKKKRVVVQSPNSTYKKRKIKHIDIGSL